VPKRPELPTLLRLTEPRSFGCGFAALWYIITTFNSPQPTKALVTPVPRDM
jgi:hypothetical protein